MTEKESLILLNLIEGSIVFKIKTLLDKFETASGVVDAISSKNSSLNEIGLFNYKDKLENAKDKFNEEMDLIQKNSINIITILDEEYPEYLRQISSPPPVLYVRGSIPQNMDLSIAVVGARSASLAGVKFAYKISYELATTNFTIVSGLAKGIDASAHKGAISAGGLTVAVLGNGLLSIYPPENKSLAEKISQECGAVISEFPMKTPPLKINFPRRNRIISGLSSGIVVVEAANKSGSLITARLALEQGRNVYAVPGSPTLLTSLGTNQLIKNGAKLITSSEDILEDMYPLLKEQLNRQVNTHATAIDKEIDAIDSNEKKIFDCLETEPVTYDEILSKFDLEHKDILVGLLNLQIKGYVRKLPGNLYVRV